MVRSTLLLAAISAVLASPLAALAQPRSIRSQAVIDLSFDEESGNPKNRAARSAQKNAAVSVNGPRRVDSPFWNQTGKKSLLLNGLRKHYVRVPAGPDTDRPTGLTASFFFLNLQPLNDGATRGLFGKRIDAGGSSSSNFGMNYIGSADSIRPYINDGAGFKYPDFSLRQTVGTRRLAYLTVTFEVGDAPGANNDNKQDDVRMRFFVNGKQVKPRKPVGTGVIIRRNDAWATKINVQRLINKAPLTIGSTNETIEFASGLIDEFLLFDRALNPREVARLFREVGGSNGAKLAAEELRPPRSPGPLIRALSSHGLQIGAKTSLTVSGESLGESPQIRLPFAGVRQTLRTGASSSNAVFELTIPKDLPAGIYPLRIQSEDGLSLPVPVVIDHLRNRAAGGTSAAKPAELPAAFVGEISGPARQRITFRGKAGQRIVADVEARRLGAAMDPVVEIKTDRGTPLVIAMGQVPLKGDARAQAVLPRDGIYSVELHDLEYNAPGRNPFRLKIGDLKIVDAWYPPVVTRTASTAVRPIGIGVRAEDSASVDPKSAGTVARILPSQRLSPAAQPMLSLSTAREHTEPLGGSSRLPPIDAALKPGSTRTVAINGIIAKLGEEDRFTLNVAGGQRLRFQLLGRAIDSPIDAEVIIRALPRRTELARGADRPQSRDPLVEATVPAGIKQIEVAVRDLHGRGGRHYLYRLLVEPAGKPDFTLDIASARLNIPANGSGFVQLVLKRTSYNGPVKLSLDGVNSLELLPDTVPAGRSGQVFVVVRDRGNSRLGDFRHVRLVGESVGMKPSIRKLARVTNRAQSVAGWEADLPMAIGQSSPFSVRVSKKPDSLFKGTRGRAAVQIKRDAKLANYAVRLSLISTEGPRRRNPMNPKLGNKPLIRSFPGQSIGPNAADGSLLIAVPADVAEPEIEFVIRADLVPHPYSARVITTAFSRPFRSAVKTAVAVTVEPTSQRLVGGTAGSVRGKIQYTPGFGGPVVLQLTGLPNGYVTKPVTIPAGRSEFAIPVTPAAEAGPRTWPKVTLTISDRFGGALLPGRVVPLTVAPSPKKTIPKKKP